MEVWDVLSIDIIFSFFHHVDDTYSRESVTIMVCYFSEDLLWKLKI